MKRHRPLTNVQKAELLEAMSRSESGIVTGAQASPLTGLLLHLMCCLVLYQQYRHEGVLYSSDTQKTAEVIESELWETVILSMNTFERLRKLTCGLKGYALTIHFDVPLDLDDIGTIETTTEAITE